MYEIEPYPIDVTKYTIEQLRYRSIRNLIRRALNDGMPPTWPTINAWMKYLPEEERQELADILQPKTQAPESQ